MSYPKKDWQDLPSQTTPVIADDLDRMEEGIANSDGAIGVNEYSTSSTYAKGDYCLHSNKLYRCITTISTAEAWNSAHWTEIKIVTEIDNTNNNIKTNLQTTEAKSLTITNCAGVNGKLNIKNGETEQDTSKLTYTCDGTETGTYYFTYNSTNYQFTMPTIAEGDVLVFDTTALTLSLNGTAITTTTGTSGTLITLSNTPNPEYPQDIISVGSNINLFDGVFESGDINGSNGTNETNDNRIRSKNYIKVPKNKNITLSILDNTQYARLIFYDASKNFIKTIYGNNVPYTFNTENAKFMRFSVNTTDTNTKAKMEQGSQATGYTPYNRGGIDFKIANGNDSTATGYKSRIVTVILPEGMEFCKIGTNKDYPYRNSNKEYKHKAILKRILTGTETWAYQNSHRFVLRNVDNNYSAGTLPIRPSSGSVKPRYIM